MADSEPHTEGAEKARHGQGTRPPGTLFLTGGTGLVGSHVAARFRERGWKIRALVRPDSDTRHLEELGARLVVGDVTDPASFSGAAAGCEILVHAAALLDEQADWDRYRRVNVEGTRHALSECVRAGCRRFVHISSVAVYGHPARQPSLPIDEDAPTDVPLDPGDHYERSKRMAERVLRRAAPGMVEWTILRPAVVMGERDRHFTPRIARLANRRLLFTVGSGDNPLPVVYAGHVAEASWLAATRDVAEGRVYNLAGGGLTQRQMLEEAARRGGRLVPLPRRAVEAGVAAWAGLSSAVPGAPRPALTPRRLWFLARPNPFSSDRIADELGWKPGLSALEGWRRALTWEEESRREDAPRMGP